MQWCIQAARHKI